MRNPANAPRKKTRASNRVFADGSRPGASPTVLMLVVVWVRLWVSVAVLTWVMVENSVFWAVLVSVVVVVWYMIITFGCDGGGGDAGLVTENGCTWEIPAPMPDPSITRAQ
jgi:hypothetical protein